MAFVCHVKYRSVTEIVTCILLTSNQMIFLVQFGINKHSHIFQRLQLHSPYGLVQYWSSLKKFTPAYLFHVALEIMRLPIQIALHSGQLPLIFLR